MHVFFLYWQQGCDISVCSIFFLIPVKFVFVIHYIKFRINLFLTFLTFQHTLSSFISPQDLDCADCIWIKLCRDKNAAAYRQRHIFSFCQSLYQCIRKKKTWKLCFLGRMRWRVGLKGHSPAFPVHRHGFIRKLLLPHIYMWRNNKRQQLCSCFTVSVPCEISSFPSFTAGNEEAKSHGKLVDWSSDAFEQ